MKKITLALLLVVTVALSAFATEGVENPAAKKVFNQQFAGAENVKWSQTPDGILKVSFTWAGTLAEAYFDSNSEFIGSGRNIFYYQVPLNVTRSVNNRFKKPVVLSVTEISTNGGTSYHIVLEESTKKYKTIINSLGEIVEVTKIKK